MMKPVRFPPGRGKLATKPSPTGSETAANTIGIVRVSRWSAAVTGVEVARITSGCRSTNSFANIRIRSTLPPAQRTSIRMLRPSVQPNSASPCVNPESNLCLRIVFVARHQHADPPHPVGLLRPRRERPRRRARQAPAMNSRRRICRASEPLCGQQPTSAQGA